VLPSEEVSSEKIEDTMAMLSDMGINVVENEDGDDGQGAQQYPCDIAHEWSLQRGPAWGYRIAALGVRFQAPLPARSRGCGGVGMKGPSSSSKQPLVGISS